MNTDKKGGETVDERIYDMSKSELEEWISNISIQAAQKAEEGIRKMSQESERRDKMFSLEEKIMASIEDTLQEYVYEEVKNRVNPDAIGEEVAQSVNLLHIMDGLVYEVEQEIIQRIINNVERNYTSDDFPVQEIAERLLEE